MASHGPWANVSQCGSCLPFDSHHFHVYMFNFCFIVSFFIVRIYMLITFSFVNGELCMFRQGVRSGIVVLRSFRGASLSISLVAFPLYL
jgi:hypothetical protein